MAIESGARGQTRIERTNDTPQAALRRYIGRRGLYSAIRATAAADTAKVIRETNWRDILQVQIEGGATVTQRESAARILPDAKRDLSIASETVRVRSTDPVTGRYYRSATTAFTHVMNQYIGTVTKEFGIGKVTDASELGIPIAKMEAADQVAK